MLGRKRGASHAGVPAAVANGGDGSSGTSSSPPAKRASQRLGGLSGPVGLLGGFSMRGAGGS